MYQNNLPVYIHYSEGRLLINSGGQAITFTAEFYLSDHLGNTRVAFTRNTTTGQAELREVTAYYPYGMNIRNLTTIYNTNKPNEYLYQGKEVDEEPGLNRLDFHARLYDPVLGRWHVQDPMLQHASLSILQVINR